MATTDLTDDLEFLLQLREGNQSAFEALYKKYSLTLYANILRMVNDPEVADDLLQDLFIKIWEKRAEINPEKSFKGYLFTCSRFLVLNFLRHISVERQVENYLSYTRSELHNPVEEAVFFKETDSILKQTLDKLPPQRQKIYALCKIEGLTYAEVATTLGISVTTVQDHIVKANKFIKEQLAVSDSLILSVLLYQLLI